ncbi:MAG: hypothetical protein M3Y64_09670 [Gemmatimonadota bacterium]|nr:hypothetical protein [Gemmatimonadota bacterium]
MHTKERMRRAISVTVAMVVISGTAQAQNEAVLRSAFEGRTVTVKVEMPATAKGIDVFPGTPMPVNWREIADRQKNNGTALRSGQSVMITKVVVKKDHIEVQLGGGGYGTIGDYSGSAVSSTDESESKREHALRDSIKAGPAPARKKELQRELDNARSERERENARAQAAAELANQTRDANIRAKRVEAGSRFNVWYKDGVPGDALRPDGVMQALAQYVDFSGGSIPASSGPGMNANAGLPPTRPLNGASALLSIRKGLLIADVEALLGPANTATESREGVLTLMKRNYLSDGKRIIASFVNGVLIDYAIAPE